jgi:hypothetical protein
MHLAQDQKTLALRLSLGRMHITSAQGHRVFFFFKSPCEYGMFEKLFLK